MAAYSAPPCGETVRPATSTLGIPRAASCQVPPADVRRITPKSDEAYSVPVVASRATSVIGRSARPFERSVHRAVPVAGSKRTSKTWPVVPGVVES